MNHSLTFETSHLVKYVSSSKTALLWNSWITFFIHPFERLCRRCFYSQVI